MKSLKIHKYQNFRRSVTKIRNLLMNWGDFSVEMRQELNVVKTNLLFQGFRNDLDPNGGKLDGETIFVLLD